MNVGTYIKQLRESKGLTQEQLGEKLGVKKAAVQKWESGTVVNLKRKTVQLLSEIFNVPPHSFFTDSEFSVKSKTQIPVLGLVRAGIPMDAVEHIIDYEEISEDMARQGEFFALQIKGDSMEPRIKEGDVVIVRKQSDVESGETAIVLVDGDEATIKKVKKFDGGIHLIPNNPNYDVITYMNKDILQLPVTILGKVVELRAKF